MANRKKEHSKEGHILVERIQNGRNLPSDKLLFECTCGWFGWIEKGMSN